MPREDWERGFAAGYALASRHHGYIMDDTERLSTRKGDVRKTARRAYEDTDKKPKRTRAKDPKLSKAMKAAYAKSHKKNGDWKKGWNRSKMFKEAHKLRRKM